MSEPRSTPNNLAARYEELRAIAVGGGHGSTSSSGFALLMQRGVAGWTAAWGRCTSADAITARAERHAPVGTAEASALIDVLTQMALASRTPQGASA